MARQSLLSVLLDLNADGFENGLQKAQRSMRRTSRSLKRSGANLTRNVTAPLGLIAVTSFKVAADFEQSMAKVKAVSGATAGEFKKLKENALELGSSTRFSASQVSALQLEFSKLGFTATEITKVTGATLNLAQATGSDLAQSAEVAGATLRAFGLNASETGRVTDVMAASFSSSALDMGSFQDSMKFVAPVARKAGLSIEQTTAMLAAMANNGIKGSQAGTALRRILSTVGATGGDVSAALEKLSKESLTLGGAQDEVGRNAQSALLVLLDSMGVVDDLSGAFENSAGAAAGMAATMDDTAEGAVKRMQSAVEGAQISIGSALAPTMLDIIKTIEKMAAGFSNLSSGTQGFIVKAGLAAAAIGPFKSSLGGMLGMISKSQTATKLLSRSLTLLANPMTALVASAGILVYALLDQAGAFEDVNRVQKKIQGISDKAQGAYVQEAAKVNALAEEYRLFEGDLQKRKTILNDLKAISPDYFGDLDSEKTKYEDLKKAVGNYTAEVKAAAIQKAFGDALVDVVAEQLVATENLRDAELRLAKAQEGVANAAKQSGGSIRDGTSGRLEASLELTAAQKAVNDATSEGNALEAERVGILGKIQRAEASLAEARSDAGLDPASSSESTDTGGGAVTATAVPIPVKFDLANDPLGDLMGQLSDELNSAASQLSLDGDQVANLDAMAKAYEKAALEAAKLGEVDLAAQLMEQARAAQEVDGIAPIMENLQRAMGVADLQAQAFGGSFDLIGAQTSALQQAISSLLEAGLTPTSTKVMELVAQLNGLSTVTVEAATAMEATAAQLGTVFENMFTTMRQGQEALTEAVVEGTMSQAEAAKKSSELQVKAVKSAALKLINIFLAEALAGVIKESFTKAPPPIAAGIAAAGVATVNALFNSLVKLKDGGMVLGPQLALIGDNPSGKEAVIPFEKMGRFLDMAGGSRGPQEVVITGRISGKDILLTNERASDQRTRVRNF